MGRRQAWPELCTVLAVVVALQPESIECDFAASVACARQLPAPLRLRGAGDTLPSVEGNDAAPSAVVRTDWGERDAQHSSIGEGPLRSKRGLLVGAQARAASLSDNDAGATAPTGDGLLAERDGKDAASPPTSVARPIEDIVVANRGRGPGDRAMRFGRAAMDGIGGLAEMEEALALARAGQMTFDDAEQRLVNLTGAAAEGTGVLVCRRAFHCLLNAAELLASSGAPECLYRANQVHKSFMYLQRLTTQSRLDILIHSRVGACAAQTRCCTKWSALAAGQTPTPSTHCCGSPCARRKSALRVWAAASNFSDT